MSAPDRIVIAGRWGECGNYYPNATEAEGEHGGVAIEYIRADLVPQWMPIETIPKDGTEVIAIRSNGWITKAVWYNNPFGRQDTVIENASGKWWSATHWMPLPTPPPAI